MSCHVVQLPAGFVDRKVWQLGVWALEEGRRGLVSEVSIFHLDAANGVSNLIYDYGFGVEAAIPALIVDALLGIVCLLLARRDGRLSELTMSYEKRAALADQAQQTEQAADRAETQTE